ncbi:MAG: hypothetical protein B7733_26535 [Myxococcales bacterium FL481]|nr:MAG: hypothetical protein B7733_26535 [Myxococcales bacterium FL481]
MTQSSLVQRLVLGLSLAFVASPAAVAAADGTVHAAPAAKPAPKNQATCRVMSILAKKEGDGSVPKNLAALEAQLRSDQFAAFKSFRLIEEKAMRVNDAADTSLAMKMGYEVRLRLLAAPARRLKLHLGLTSKGAAKPLLDADYSVAEGGVLLVVAGQRDGGRALFAFQCRRAD